MYTLEHEPQQIRYTTPARCCRGLQSDLTLCHSVWCGWKQSNTTTYAHTASTSTQFHSGMGTQTQTDCSCIFHFLNPSSFGVVPNNLASHAHVIPTYLPSHIDCISAFQDINTVKNGVTCTQTGQRDTVVGV